MRQLVSANMRPTVDQRCRYAALYQVAREHLGNAAKRDNGDEIGAWDKNRFREEISKLEMQLREEGISQITGKKSDRKTYSPRQLYALERFQSARVPDFQI